jgi:hypothetical protein
VESKPDYLKFLPAIGTLFILFGLLVANFYYSAFYIDIFPYIEFGEAIMLFLNVITPLLVVFAIITILFLLYSDEQEIKHTGSGTENIAKIILVIFPLFFIAFDLVIAPKITKYGFLKIAWYAYWFPFCKLIYTFVNVRLFMKQTTKGYNQFLGFNIIAIFIFGLICTSELEVINTLKSKTRKVELQLKDSSVIKNDSNLIFLGKTKNYFIFYNINTKEAMFTGAGLVDKIMIRN